MSTPHQKRTIVRAFKVPLRQRAVGGLSRFLPSPAAWLAERLFLSPPRFRAPDRERDLLGRARPITLRVAGRRIAAWTRGTGPRVLLVHGWGGRGSQLGSIVEPLISSAWLLGGMVRRARSRPVGRAPDV